MIKMSKNEFQIDGKAQLIIAGEVHYFRIPVERWEETLVELKAAGMNTVSTYMPWIIHEEVEGEYDFDGHKKANQDLISFIKLVQKLDLYLIARPGPFIMAELKNEGIPYWVREKNPDAIPNTWDGQTVTTSTIDYSNQGYRRDAKKWMQAIGNVLKPFLHPNGGPIIGVQLDNEVGMLSWVSHSPDITDQTISDFSNWLDNRYAAPRILPNCYSMKDNPTQFKNLVAAPTEATALQIRFDLSLFMRTRYKDYFQFLIDALIEIDVVEIPYLINVHGTDQGRGETFPIGISQLYDTFTLDNVLVGTDVYFGDFDLTTATHLYTLNKFMSATGRSWPLSSLEFNASTGNNTDHLEGQKETSAIPLKTRLQLAEGTKVLNYYLFSGGYNRSLEVYQADGNSRVGIHGWRHGFGAMVNPEGKISYAYPRIAQVNQEALHNHELLSRTTVKPTKLAIGFDIDDFMTEYYYPNSHISNEYVNNLSMNRAKRPWNNVLKNLLSAKFNYDAIDLKQEIPDPKKTPTMIYLSSRYMAAKTQQLLVQYIQDGGHVLLIGELPEYDLVGESCHTLIDQLEVIPGAVVEETPRLFPSVQGLNWNQDMSEVRVEYYQTFTYKNGQAFLQEIQSKQIVAATVPYGQGSVDIICTELRFDPVFYTKLLAQNQIVPEFKLMPNQDNILAFQTDVDQGSFIHLLNTLDTEVHFEIAGLFNRHMVTIHGRDGLMLPQNLKVAGVTVTYSTAELLRYTENQELIFKINELSDVIAVPITQRILPSQNYWIETEDNDQLIHPTNRGSLVINIESGVLVSY